MAQQFLLGSTDLNKAALARVGDQDSLDSYAELANVIRARCGPEVASLFAEPVRGFNRATQIHNVTWFGAYEGTPYPFTQLDAAALKPVAEILRQRLKSFSELLPDPRWGPQLASWLYVLSPADVLSIGGQPVIKNWGMIPAEISASEEAREAHFRRTTEPYAPRIPLPPFNGEEAQSFVQRLAQLAARDNSVAARPALGRTAAATEPPLAPPPVAVPARVAPSRSYRPWLAPLIATVVAAAILAAIEFLRLLVYPPAGLDVALRADVQTQKAANDALEQRLNELQALSGKVCQVAPGTTNPADGIDLQKILPQPLEKTQVTPAPTSDQPAHPLSMAALLNDASVIVLTKEGSGSGFFISDHNIVTNHHVTADFNSVKVGNRALGGFVEAKVIAVGEGRGRGTEDLAVLEIDPKPGVQSLRISSVPAQLARVTAAGFPGAVLQTIQMTQGGPLPEANLTQGIVTSHQNQQPAGIGTIIHTATIGHGNSGGPLVDEGGCAVGVNSWLAFDSSGSQVFQTFDQALDAAELRKFLDAKGVKYVGSDTPCAAAAPVPVATPAPTPSPDPAPSPAPAHP